MHREYSVLKIYTKLNIYAGVIMGALEIYTRSTVGDEVKGLIVTLDRIELFMILVLQIATICLAYPFFIRTKDKDIIFRPGGKMKFRVDYDRFHVFLFILIALNIFVSMRWGNGKVNLTGTAYARPGFVSLFNIIQIRPLFNIYYVCCRDTKKIIYWINTALFLIFRVICGWTGDIFGIIFLEMFLFVKHNRHCCLVNTLFKMNDLIVAAAFSVGSYLYCVFFPIKNAIRFGRSIGSFSVLPYFDGVQRLISRFTNYPVSVAAVQNHVEIAKLYQQQGKPFWEVEAIFAPLLPRFLMPNKEFRPLANLVSLAFDPTHGPETGAGYWPVGYWLNIFESNMLCFVVGLIVFVVFFIITKKIIYAFDDGSKDVEYLYYVFCLGIFNGGTLNGVFGYGYLSMLYTIPIMWFLGIIKKQNVEYGASLMKHKMKKSWPIKVRIDNR